MRISKYAKGYSYETSVTDKEEHCMDSQAAVSRTGSKLHRENQALCAPMFGTQLHHRGVSVGIKKFPDRVRFTRALLESKDLSMLFSFPCAFGSPGSAPAPWKQPLSKDLQEPLIPQAGKWSSQAAGQASLLRARRGSQTACVCKPLFARNGLASPKGDLQICSEVGNSRGSVQGADCPWPTLQRHS